MAIGAMLVGTLLRFLVPLVASGTIDFALGDGGGSRLVVIFERFIGKSWLAGHLWVPALVMVVLTAGSGYFNYIKNFHFYNTINTY